ncbi:N-lysine methyltransferase KMT5A-like [Ptychodera flava]|uniref:N-lysine methyltransferase KMT5A-like n=1 Tax=Ptychodera flava TaxID=63121 RepID=UPI00396A4853
MAGEKDPQISDPKSRGEEASLIKPSTSKDNGAGMKSPAKESKITRFFAKSPFVKLGKRYSPSKHRDSQGEIEVADASKGAEAAATVSKPGTPEFPEKEKESRKDEEECTTKSKPRSSKSRGKQTGKGKQHKTSKPKSASQGKRTSKVPSQKSVLTDFFSVRRSSRRCKSDIEAAEQKKLQEAILSQQEDGLAVKEFEGKGRGVVATKNFMRGEFVVEYAGDLIDIQTAKKREEEYAAKPEVGCYIYYFSFNNKTYCIDATAESGRLGRLINHSKTEANCVTKKIAINDKPYLILVAKRDIKVDEELLYDYGDRSKTSLAAHPWLSS